MTVRARYKTNALFYRFIRNKRGTQNAKVLIEKYHSKKIKVSTLEVSNCAELTRFTVLG